MAGYQGKTTNWLDDAIANKIQEYRDSQWGEIDGKIVSFDAAKQTATVQPLYKPRHNGKPVDMPQLFEVPVRFTRAGGGMAVTFPIKAGDNVTLRPKMRSTENYHSGEDNTASDARTFSLADMEAYLDGGEPVTAPLENFDSMNAHMRFNASGSFGLKGSPDGKMSLKGAQGDVMDLLAQAVELLASDGLNVKTGSSAGTNHELQHRAKYLAIAQKLRAMVLA